MTGKRNGNFVLVTGGSRGIGRGAALSLAEAGFDLILWSRSSSELDETAEKCMNLGRQAVVAKVDVSDAASVESAGRSSLASVDSLRGLVLNAGIGIWNTLDKVSAEEWHQILSTNLDGAFNTLKIAVPLLIRNPSAQIVAVASDSGEYTYAGRSAYCASKWGMRGLVEAIRREVRPHGVRVTQLLPSRVDTYFRGKTPGGRPDSLSIEEVAQIIRIIFSLPARVEVREVPVAAITSSYGPYPEVKNVSDQGSEP